MLELRLFLNDLIVAYAGGPNADSTPRQRHHHAQAAGLYPSLDPAGGETGRGIGSERDHDPPLAGTGNGPGPSAHAAPLGDNPEPDARIRGGGVAQAAVAAVGRLAGGGPRFVCPDLSRSALDRCLRRHGVAARLADLLPEVEGKPPLPKTFKNDEPGLVQVDIKYLPRMPDETEHRYLIVAIDRASRWVYYEIQPDKTGDTAAGFLERLRAKAPFRLRTVLTEYGKAFTDRFGATGAREPTGQHRFDHVCAAHGIDHRLIKPRHPQTNGMIERFNGRIAEVLKTTTFASARQLETTLQRYLHLYNHYIPQKNLGHVAPITKLKDYYRTKPALFQKRPINLPGPDSSSICLGSNAPMTSRRQV